MFQYLFVSFVTYISHVRDAVTVLYVMPRCAAVLFFMSGGKKPIPSSLFFVVVAALTGYGCSTHEHIAQNISTSGDSVDLSDTASCSLLLSLYVCECVCVRCAV